MNWLSRLTTWLLGEKYLVLETHYEGIESVYGTFSRAEAIAFTNERKRRAKLLGDAWDAREEAGNRASERTEAAGLEGDAAYEAYKADPELVAAEAAYDRAIDEHGFGPKDPDFVCVVTVSREGTRCACAELGVKPSKPMLR